MSANWEIFTILGVVIAGAAFWITYHKKPKEEKRTLIVTFRTNQSLAKKNIENLKKLADEANGWQSEFSQGMSYKTAYDLMVENYDKNLSDATIENLIKEKGITQGIMASMQKSLEAQQENLINFDLAIQAAKKTWEASAT